MTALDARASTQTDSCPPWCVDHDSRGGLSEHRTKLVAWSDRPGFGVSLCQPVGDTVQLYVSWGEEQHQQADVGDSLSAASPCGVTGDELLELGMAILRAGAAMLDRPFG
jgi:hypothetical protein